MLFLIGIKTKDQFFLTEKKISGNSLDYIGYNIRFYFFDNEKPKYITQYRSTRPIKIFEMTHDQVNYPLYQKSLQKI